MSPAGRSLPARRRLRSSAGASVVAASALLAVVLPGTAAVADERAATTVVGELVQAWAETGDHGHLAEAAPAPVSWIETDTGSAVPVASGDVADLPPGSTVSLTVGAEQTEDGGTAHPVLDAELLRTPATERTPAGPLTNEVTVAMVAPAGTPAGPRVPLQDVVDLVDGPVARFWADETAGAVALGVIASHEWIGTTAGCATPAKLWNEVAAEVGFVPGPGRHLVLYIPPTAPGCSYALAEVGSSLFSGGRVYVRDTSASAIAHELGHNFGLAHSSGRQCDGAVEGGRCRTVGYRDYYDVMGVSWERTGSLNVVQAAYLGVLPAEQTVHLGVQAAPATVPLAPVSGSGGVRALRLTDAAGVNYWLEYRPAAGRDAWLGSDRFALDAGVLLRRTDRFPDTSVLLDGTPTRAAGWDDDLQAALAVGSPVAVSGGQFTIEVLDVTADGAVVSVVPTPPAVAPDATVPAAEPVPGTLLPGDRAPSGAQAPAPSGAEVPDVASAAEAPTAVAAPDLSPIAGAPAAAETTLAAASESTGGGYGPVVAGLATAVAGATMLVVRRFRAARR